MYIKPEHAMPLIFCLKTKDVRARYFQLQPVPWQLLCIWLQNSMAVTVTFLLCLDFKVI